MIYTFLMLFGDSTFPLSSGALKANDTMKRETDVCSRQTGNCTV